jgi:AcrR family transcriptional regulator
MQDKPSSRRSAGWKQDPAGVRKNILAVAMAEFAANGLSGARIDEIAAKTNTSKRMIYYYFGDKEGLYGRVLEEAYRQVRAGEQELDLEHLPPVEALRKLAEFTFDHHSRNPDFIRIVMIENIHTVRARSDNTLSRWCWR